MALLHTPNLTNAAHVRVADGARVIDVSLHLRRRPGHDPLPTFDDYRDGPPRVRLPEDEFARRFGADEKDVALVKAHYGQFGLLRCDHHLARRRVYLRGTVSQFNAIFGIELHDYQRTRNGHTITFHSHAVTPQIPDHLAGIITRTHNLAQRTPFPNVILADGPQPAAVEPAVPAGIQVPALFAAIYQMQLLPSGNSPRWTAAGQNIGVYFPLGNVPASPTDVNATCALYSCPVPHYLYYAQDGSLPPTSGGSAAWTTENTLDISMLSIFAAHAQVIGTIATSDDDAYYTRLAHPAGGDPAWTIGSASVAYPESEIADGTGGAGSPTEPDDVYEDCAIQGVTLLAASGDWGSCGEPVGGTQSIDACYPASVPYITAVGGSVVGATSGTVSAANFVEFMFGTNATNTGPFASGGGVSILFPLPSYQATAGVPANLNPTPGPFGTAGRGTPDISALMDQDIPIYENGTQKLLGGTSQSCPIVAGVIACVNSTLGWNVGFINPALYALNGTSSIRRAAAGGPPDNSIESLSGQKITPAYPTSTTGYSIGFGLGVLLAQPFITYLKSVKGIAQITGITLNNQTIPPGATFGTVVGAVSVAVSSGSFIGDVAIEGTNQSSFMIDGNSLVFVQPPVSQSSYSISLVAIQTGATNTPFAQSFVITESTTTGPSIMTIPVITPGNGSFVALGGTWTVTTAGLMAFTGAGGPGTSSGVTQATFINGAVWQFNGTNWYGTTTPGSYPLGGTTTAPWSVPVTGLKAGTSYDFEVTASNAGGTGPASSPIVTTSTLTSNGTGIFTTSGRNVIGPNGNVYQPRGMNIWADAGQDLSKVYNLVSTQAPGTNFVRAYYEDSNNFTTNQTAINYLTSQGIVVVICDNSFHNEALGNGNADQTTFVNRAAGIASLFPSPLVWIEGENEPAGNQPTANGQMMAALYTAVRAVDAHKIIVFNGADDGSSAEILPSSIFSSMTNVVWSQHFYNWESGDSGTQSVIQAAYQTDLNNIMSFFNGPIMCGEYGESTGQGTPPTGVNGDNGGATLLQVIHNFVTSGAICGDCYFQWYSGGVPGTYVTLSLFTSLTGGVPLGNLTNTCQVGNNSSSGCGPVALQWIASSQGTANT